MSFYINSIGNSIGNWVRKTSEEDVEDGVGETADVSENTDIDTLKILLAKEVGCDPDMDVFDALRHYMHLHGYKGVLNFARNEATVEKGDKITRQAFDGKATYHRRALMLAFMYMRNLEKMEQAGQSAEKASDNTPADVSGSMDIVSRMMQVLETRRGDLSITVREDGSVMSSRDSAGLKYSRKEKEKFLVAISKCLGFVVAECKNTEGKTIWTMKDASESPSMFWSYTSPEDAMLRGSWYAHADLRYTSIRIMDFIDKNKWHAAINIHPRSNADKYYAYVEDGNGRISAFVKSGVDAYDALCRAFVDVSEMLSADVSGKDNKDND